MQKRFQIFHKCIDMSALFIQTLCLVGTLQCSSPCPDHQYGKKKCCHTVEQDQNRLISLCININLICLIPDFFLFHCSKCSKHRQELNPIYDHKHDICYFYCQKEQTFDLLLMYNISKSHQHHGEFCLHAAFPDRRLTGIRCREIIDMLFSYSHPFLTSLDSVAVHCFIHGFRLLSRIIMCHAAVSDSFTHIFHRSPAVVHLGNKRLKN